MQLQLTHEFVQKPAIVFSQMFAYSKKVSLRNGIVWNSFIPQTSNFLS